MQNQNVNANYDNESIDIDWGSYVKAPVGQHLAVISKIVETGTIGYKWKNDKNQSGDGEGRFIYLFFELVNTNHVFDEKKGPEPHIVPRKFSLRMGGSSKLKAFIAGMYGVSKISDEEAKKINPAKLLGRYCIVTLVEDGEYINVASAVPVPATDVNGNPITLTPQRTETLLFNFKLPAKVAEFKKLAYRDGKESKLQQIIRTAKEYPEWVKAAGTTTQQPGFTQPVQQVQQPQFQQPQQNVTPAPQSGGSGLPF